MFGCFEGVFAVKASKTAEAFDVQLFMPGFIKDTLTAGKGKKGAQLAVAHGKVESRGD